MSADADGKAMRTIRHRAEDLELYLSTWRYGEDRPGSRRALSHAVGELDKMLAAAYGLRASLVGQGRAWDDEAARRADATLAAVREGRA